MDFNVLEFNGEADHIHAIRLGVNHGDKGAEARHFGFGDFVLGSDGRLNGDSIFTRNIHPRVCDRTPCH